MTEPVDERLARFANRKLTLIERMGYGVFSLAGSVGKIFSAVGLAAALIFNLALIAGCAYGVYASFRYSTALGLALLLPGVVLFGVAAILIWRDRR